MPRALLSPAWLVCHNQRVSENHRHTCAQTARILTWKTLIALLFVITPRYFALAQSGPTTDVLDRNAALSYWQAFALLPPIDDEMRRAMGEAASGERPLDDKWRGLVASSEAALSYLHRGTGIERCVWGLAYEKGPYVMLPHLTKARDLARIALLRARMRFEAGDSVDAIDDIVAAMTLGRHAGREGVIVLIPLLVDYAIEYQSIETIAQFLPTLSPTERQSLQRRLRQLPPQRTLQDAMAGEKEVFVTWLVHEVEKGEAKQRIIELAGDSDIGAGYREQVNAATQSQLARWANDLKPIYDAMADAMLLPPDEVKAREAELMNRLKDQEQGNPLGAMFLPSFGAARNVTARQQTRSALLQAAFAVVQDGEAALTKPEHRDPFGDGPFEYRKTDSGFELVSDYVSHKDTHVSLRVGDGK